MKKYELTAGTLGLLSISQETIDDILNKTQSTQTSETLWSRISELTHRTVY